MWEWAQHPQRAAREVDAAERADEERVAWPLKGANAIATPPGVYYSTSTSHRNIERRRENDASAYGWRRL